MTWAVCIVGKVSAALRVVDERFREGARGPLQKNEEACYRLAREVVLQQLEAAGKVVGDQYISITAAGDESPGVTEIKMAIRLLPGFVE